MSYVDKTVGLSAEVVAEHRLDRGRRLYLMVEFTSSFSNMKTQVHMVYGSLSMCFFENKSSFSYKFWLRDDGAIFTEHNPPMEVLVPTDAGFTTVSESFRLYALGYINYKSYSAELVTDATVIDDLEVTYRYLSISMQSSGHNMRYGIQVRNIPVIGTLSIEHVHTEDSEGSTDLRITLLYSRA